MTYLLSFDISVIDKNLNEYGIAFTPTMKVDTMAVAKDVLYNFSTQSGDLKLNMICDRCGKLHSRKQRNNTAIWRGTNKSVNISCAGKRTSCKGT